MAKNTPTPSNCLLLEASPQLQFDGVYGQPALRNVFRAYKAEDVGFMGLTVGFTQFRV